MKVAELSLFAYTVSTLRRLEVRNPEKKPLQIQLDPDLHAELKKFAKRAGRSMANVSVDFIKEGIVHELWERGLKEESVGIARRFAIRHPYASTEDELLAAEAGARYGKDDEPKENA